VDTPYSTLLISTLVVYFLLFLFTDPATTDIYTLSLHDALPILRVCRRAAGHRAQRGGARAARRAAAAASARLQALRAAVEDLRRDRKSTRLNSSHVSISYAVFCLKKKKI